jgi:drug/metabolite transporter (DMT)-like permease
MRWYDVLLQTRTHYMGFLHSGEMAAIVTAVLWTFSTIAWTSAGKRAGTWAVSFLRLVLACPMFILYGGLVSGQWLPLDADGRTWAILAVSGVFGFLFCDLCLIRAFTLIGARLSLLIFSSLTPPLSAIIAWYALGDKLLWHQWLGMVVTLSGVTWVVLEEPETVEGVPLVDRGHFWQGVVLALVASVAATIGYVMSKEGIGGYDPFAATMIRVLGGLAGYVILIPLLRRWPSIVKAVQNGPVMAIIAAGTVVGPFVGVALSMIALRDCNAGVAVTIISTMPVLILPISVFLYHEKVSYRAIGGALISITGVAMLVLGQEIIDLVGAEFLHALYQ